MKKKISLILCFAICCSMALTGCGSKTEQSETPTNSTVTSNVTVSEDTNTPTSSVAETPSTTTTATESTASEADVSKLSKEEALGLQFLTAVQKKDWDTVHSCLATQTVDFITNEDLEWILPRTELADLADSTGTITVEGSELVDKEQMKYAISCSCDGKDYTVDVRMMDDNSLRVFWDEAVISDATAIMPKGCTIEYEGIQYKVDDLGKDCVNAVALPCREAPCSLVRRPSTCTVANTLGDKAELELSVNDENVLKMFAKMDIASERAKEIMTDAYKMYTELYTALDTGASDAKILSYLASDVPTEYITTLRNNHEVKQDNNEHKNYKFNSIDFTNIADGSEVSIEGGEAFYLYMKGVSSGTLDYGYGHAMSNTTFSGRDILLVIRYEDGKAKLVNVNGNEKAIFGRFH